MHALDSTSKTFTPCLSAATAVILPQGATYSLYDNAGGDFPLIDFTCTAPFTDEFIVIPLGYDGDYLSDFERLKELYITGRGRLKMLGILYGIFDRLSSEGHIPSVLTSAFNYISENISDSALKNREIAESIGVSECYLRRLFSENYGKSPRKYILEQRINLSCDMLCSQSVSVGEIADKCGFSSVYHFCRAFKERTGLTPTEKRIEIMVYNPHAVSKDIFAQKINQIDLIFKVFTPLVLYNKIRNRGVFYV